MGESLHTITSHLCCCHKRSVCIKFASVEIAHDYVWPQPDYDVDWQLVMIFLIIDIDHGIDDIDGMIK